MCATFSASLSKIGPVTLEIMRVTGISALFGADSKNWYIPPNISANTLPIIAKLSVLVDICIMIVKLTIVLQ